ncbi:MAG TPA: hypothetical protein VGR02_02290 [Thermoanaerobaculia bacterium]|nr:hypothetical protein [Thermoanaerobaculia bacterium]
MLLLLFFCAAVAAAQPMPQPPFPEPIGGVVGRYGASAPSYASSGLDIIVISPGGIAKIYRMATFPSRAAAANGQPITPDATIDPGDPNSGWEINSPNLDSVGFDRRGYIAVSFGQVGIVDTSGHLLKQLTGTYGVTLVFDNGGKTYLLTENPTLVNTLIYDMTNPAAPVLTATLPFLVDAAAEANGRIVVSTSNQHELRFYQTSVFLSGGAPLQTVTSGDERFAFLATNGTDFITASHLDSMHTTAITSLFAASGGTYQRTSSISIPNMFTTRLSYEAGYLVLAGYRSDNFTAPAGSIFTIDGQTLVQHDIRPFIEQTYGPPNGGAELSLTPFSTGGRTYLMADMFAASDLFIFAPTDPNAIPATSTWALIVLGAVLCALALGRLRV